MNSKRALKNQKGFTLIEIIAVLVILGILAAVAIPKFMDLQSEAKNKAVQGALAAGGSNVAMVFSQGLLSSGTTPTMASLAGSLTTSIPADKYTIVGDFKVSYTEAPKGITVAVTEGPTGTAGATSTAYMTGVTNYTKTFNLIE